jgi:hypothetical protein
LNPATIFIDAKCGPESGNNIGKVAPLNSEVYEHKKVGRMSRVRLPFVRMKMIENRAVLVVPSCFLRWIDARKHLLGGCASHKLFQGRLKPANAVVPAVRVEVEYVYLQWSEIKRMVDESVMLASRNENYNMAA